MIFQNVKRAAQLALGFALLVNGLQGCEVNNSSVSDRIRFNPNPNQGTSESSPHFKTAKAVIFETCISCHGKWKNYTQEDFLNKRDSEGEPLVVPGDLARSQIYQRIKGVGALGDMPDNSTILSLEQRQAIADWILSIEKETLTPVEPPVQPPLPPIEPPTPPLEPPPQPPTPPVEPPVTPPPADTPESRFAAAQALIMAKCMSCHEAGSDDGDFESLTEAGYLAAKTFEGNPLVVPGNPEASELYFRLKGIFADGDMPRRRAALTQEEADILKNWILKINQN